MPKGKRKLKKRIVAAKMVAGATKKVAKKAAKKIVKSRKVNVSDAMLELLPLPKSDMILVLRVLKSKSIVTGMFLFSSFFFVFLLEELANSVQNASQMVP